MTQTRSAAKYEKENIENDIQTQSPNSSQSVINTEDCSAENQKKELLMKKEIIINDYYHIVSSFTATDYEEISVKKDEIVQVINIKCGRWIKILCSDSAIGLIPREHLDFIRKILKKPSNWSSVESHNSKLEKYWKYGKQNQIKIGVSIALWGVLLPVLFYYVSPHYTLIFFSCQSTVHTNQFNIPSEMHKLENKFKNQSEDLWLTLESCLNSVLSGKHPCILILMNPGKGNIDCLLNDIGSASSRLLTGQDSSITTLEGSKLKFEVFSFEKCKSDLERYRVMLISGMESIQGKVLEQFHAFCDIYDPAIKQSVIVFTLNYKGIKLDNTDFINDNTLASNLLEKHWQNSIHHDTIGAITIRLTENVARINPIVC